MKKPRKQTNEWKREGRKEEEEEGIPIVAGIIAKGDRRRVCGFIDRVPNLQLSS
jgi:hypothetical protein